MASTTPKTEARVTDLERAAPDDGYMKKARETLPFIFTVAGTAMVPWLFVLATSLPATTVVPHYSTAWVGLDAVEAVGLFTTGRLLARNDRRYALTAAVTGTALLLDAWFDVLGATGAAQLATALVMAGCAELPLAAVCGRLALHGTRTDPPAVAEAPCKNPVSVYSEL
jgi:hypothetical protein